MTTAATGSPTYRTVSLASRVWVIAAFQDGIIGLMTFRSATSAAVYTASTPGAAFASVASMAVIRPCATGDRTNVR